jgi:hypothetical protein
LKFIKKNLGKNGGITKTIKICNKIEKKIVIIKIYLIKRNDIIIKIYSKIGITLEIFVQELRVRISLNLNEYSLIFRVSMT